MSNQVPQLTSDEWYSYVCLNRFVSLAELSAMTGFSEEESAHHLATLREQGLIEEGTRQGSVVYRRTSGASPVGSDGSDAASPAEADRRHPTGPFVAEDDAPPEEDPSGTDTPGWIAGLPWREPEPASQRFRNRFARADVALVIATVVALVSALLLAASGDPEIGSASQSGAGRVSEDAGRSPQAATGPTTQAPADQTPQPPPPEGPTSTPEPAAGDLRLQVSSYSGEPFESVPIQGQYVGAEAGTDLRVQVQQDGEWVSFPLPAVTGEDGTFSTRVELGPGQYRLRIADLESDVVSDEFSLRIG